MFAGAGYYAARTQSRMPHRWINGAGTSSATIEMGLCHLSRKFDSLRKCG